VREHRRVRVAEPGRVDAHVAAGAGAGGGEHELPPLYTSLSTRAALIYVAINDEISIHARQPYKNKTSVA